MKITATSQSDRALQMVAPFRLVTVLRFRDERIATGESDPVETTDRDADLLEFTDATIVRDARLSFSHSGPLPASGAVWSTLTPDIATVAQDGVVSHQSVGDAVIRLTAGDQQLDTKLAMTSVGGQTQEQFISHVAGSAAAHATAQIESRIAGKTPETALPLFSSQDHAAGNYTRAASSWLTGLDMSCASPYNSAHGTARGGTLIAPDVILFAGHFEIAVGSVIRFVADDGTVVDRTMVSRLRHPDYRLLANDISIGRLSAAVPSSIKPCKVLPITFANQLPVISALRVLPALSLNQNRDAFLVDMRSLVITAQYQLPTRDRAGWAVSLTGGDSGQPQFLLVNGEPILLSVWTWPGMGSSVVYNTSTINAMMTAIGSSHQLTQADLSGYTNYG